MTRPGNRPPSASEQRLAASLSGAVDLSGVKQRAEARRQSARSGPAAGGGAPLTTITADETTFESEILVRSTRVPVVVELTSAQAGRTLTDALDQMAAADGGRWVHAVIDVDRSPQVAQAFQTQTVPTVVALAGGRPLADFEGDQSQEWLRQWIDAVLQATEGKLQGPGPEDTSASEPGQEPGEAEDPERDAAEAALAEGDLEGAEATFSALVEQRPGDHSLLEALRYVQAARRVELEQSGEDEQATGMVATALRASDRALISGDYAGAFRTLIDTVRVTAGDDRDAVRTRLLELLDSLPPTDPQVLAARRDLAGALY